jgi:hypothetical protein
MLSQQGDDTMSKRTVLGMVAVFVAWEILDYLIHNVILSATYSATAELWRPMAEMKMGWITLAAAVGAITFVLIYNLLVDRKSVQNGIVYGLLYGIGVGFGMGFGTYGAMPIPGGLAVAWFIGTVVEAVVAGLLVGLIVKAPAEPAAA